MAESSTWGWLGRGERRGEVAELKGARLGHADGAPGDLHSQGRRNLHMDRTSGAGDLLAGRDEARKTCHWGQLYILSITLVSSFTNIPKLALIS
jgi:hypothetical protein